MKTLYGLSQRERAIKIIEILRGATRGLVEPASDSIVATYGRDPYLVLISCVLSLRTKDSVSLPASLRLFALGTTPQAHRDIPLSIIEKTIYPVCFYRVKA